MDAPTIRVISFKTEFEKNPDTGKFDRAVDWVEYAPSHAVTTSRTWDKVSRLMPPDAIENDDEGKKIAFMRHRWAMIEPAYEAYKSGQDLPVHGTPLSAWAGLTRQQADILMKSGVRTVEELAAMTDSLISKAVLPNMRDIVATARQFLETTDRSVAAETMARQQAEIDALREQNEAIMALLEERSKPAPADDKDAKKAKEAA